MSYTCLNKCICLKTKVSWRLTANASFINIIITTK